MTVAWATLGVLAATVVASLFYLGNKIDVQGAELGSRIDALGARLDALDVSLGTRIDTLTVGVDGLNARLDDHTARHRHVG